MSAAAADDYAVNEDSTGHYDLQIGKSAFAVSTKTLHNEDQPAVTRNYSNPIVSYGVAGVTICNVANHVYDAKQLLCRKSFSTNDAGIAALINWIQTYCEYDAAESSGYNHVYKVVSGGFATYDFPEHNCFAAAATWCDLMGYSTLMSIYREKSYPNGQLDLNGYVKYYAWETFETSHPYWSFDTLNRN